MNEPRTPEGPVPRWKIAWEAIKDQWIRFLVAILGPLVVVPLACAAGLAWVNVELIGAADSTSPGRELQIVVQVLFALAMAVAGGDFARRWREMAEAGATEAKLFAKGDAAIRGLRLIYKNLNQLILRLRDYDVRLNVDGQDVSPDNIQSMLDKCSAIEDGVINAIEEWKDVIPSAALRARVRAVIEQREADVEARISATQERLQAATPTDSEEVERLREQLRELREERDDLRHEALGRALSGLTSSGIAYATAATTTVPSSTGPTPTIGELLAGLGAGDDPQWHARQCTQCGNWHNGYVCGHCEHISS